MNVINIFNPFSNKHHACQDFSKLRGVQKFTVIFLTTLVSALTLYIGMVPLFRTFVHKYVKINTLNSTPTIKKVIKESNPLLFPLNEKKEEKKEPSKQTDFNSDTEQNKIILHHKNSLPRLFKLPFLYPNPAKDLPFFKSIGSLIGNKLQSSNHSALRQVLAENRHNTLSLIPSFSNNHPKPNELHRFSVKNHLLNVQGIPLKVNGTVEINCFLKSDSSYLYGIKINGTLRNPKGKSKPVNLQMIHESNHALAIEQLQKTINNNFNSLLTQSKTIEYSNTHLPRLRYRPFLRSNFTDRNNNPFLYFHAISFPKTPKCIRSMMDNKLQDSSILKRKITENSLRNSFTLTDSDLDFDLISKTKSLYEERETLNYQGSFNLKGILATIFDLNLSDETVVNIDENNQVNYDETYASPHQVDLFFEMIKSTFGRALGQTICNRYFRNINTGDSLITKVTFGDYRKAFVGAATNVKDQDLRALFNEIKEDRSDIVELLCKDSLNPELKKEIAAVETFEELSPKHIYNLYTCFTYFCNENGQYLSVFRDLLNRQILKPSAVQFDNYLHDAFLLSKISEYTQIDPKNPSIGTSEHLAKSLIYMELKEGMLIPLLNSKGSYTYSLYKVHKVTESKGDAVFGALLIPVNLELSFTLNKQEAFLVFRGTCPEPSQQNSMESWMRDLDFYGIGKTSFQKRAGEILSMVESYLRTCNDNVTIHVTGHSLGGCDTQRALLSLMQKINDSSKDEQWKKIAKLDVKTYNAPRVEEQSIKEFIAIHDQLELKKLKLKIDLTHIRYKDLDRHDLVQWYGDMLIGAKINNSSFLKTSAVFITMKENFGAFGIVERHGSCVYSSFQKVPIENLERFEDANSKGLQEILEQNHYWNKEEANIMNYATWYLAPLYTVPRDIFHYTAIHAGLSTFVLLTRATIKPRDLSEKTILAG